MAPTLWTNHFMRICLANLLMFISLYVMFPVLPLEMAGRLGVPVTQTGIMFLFFTLGMFLIGPFHAYLIDAYKRKFVCIFSLAAMMAATVGYAFVSSLTELLLLSTAQGVAFGLATTAGITLAIDVTGSTLRSAGNVSLSWITRFGMIAGVALGIWFYQTYGFRDSLYLSITVGSIGILSAWGVYVPFRAPIVTKLYSLDRFLLPRAWLPSLNLILIAFIPGLLIASVHPYLNSCILGGIGRPLPFFLGIGVGFLCSLLLFRMLRLKDKTLRTVIMGISLLVIGMVMLMPCIPMLVPAVILGLGLGLAIPEFLLIFVKLSEHCQRGTANTTHLLCCEIGFSLGMATSCVVDMDQLVLIGQLASGASLLFFLLLTYPYFLKMKIR